MIVEYLLRAARVGSTWVLYLMLALSVISIAAMAERWLYFRRLRDHDRRLRDKIVAAFRERCRRNPATSVTIAMPR